MRNSIARTLVAIAAVTLLGTSMAVAAEDVELVPRTEAVFLGIGCQGDTVCDSTEYWLGRAAGESNVGTTNTISPINQVNYLNGGSWQYADFFADDSLASSYVLRTDEPVAGQVTMGGFITGAEVGADSTIRVELRASLVGGGQVTLGTAEETKIVAIPGDRVYPFEFTIDEELDRAEVRNLTLALSVRGVHVLQNGFVNGSGDSYFDLPYYEVVEPEAG